MVEGIENIKRIYEPILNDDHEYKTMNNLVDFENYLVETFDKMNSKRSTRVFLYESGLFPLTNTPTKLDNLMIEAIYSNLYCDIVIILQNINKKHTTTHEQFITRLQYDSNENLKISKKCIERFRKRMQPGRLKLIDKFRIGDETTCCYCPSVSRVYKDVLFVRRNNCGVWDISENYADIFSYLMFDTDEEASREALKKSKEILKSYCIWDFSKSEVSGIREVYQNIFKGSHDNIFKTDSHAEFMLMEKMFGFFNIAKLINFDSTSDNNIKRSYLLQKLGYTSLHEYLLEEIYLNGNYCLEHDIENHIYPVCYRTLHEVINNIIYFIKESTSVEETTEFLNAILKLCKSKITFIPDENMLAPISSVTGKRVARIIKVRNSLHRLKSKEDFYNSIYCFKKEFSEDYYDAKYNETLNFRYLFDKSFTDLTLYYKKKERHNKDEIDFLETLFKPPFITFKNKML